MSKTTDLSALSGRPVLRQQAKLSDQVYDVILTRIVKGQFPEGTKLPTETVLASEFAVSRPVVREALARLRDDGLIQPRQGAGSFVIKRPGSALLRFAPIGSIADIQRCFEFRIAVEPIAARLAASRRDTAMVSVIHDLVKAQDEAGSGVIADVNSDFLFHKAVADASGNGYFSTTVQSLEESMKTAMLLNRQLSLENPRNKLHLRQAEHNAIFEAIAASDGDAAYEAMRNHIDVARRRIFDGEGPT